MTEHEPCADLHPSGTAGDCVETHWYPIHVGGVSKPEREVALDGSHGASPVDPRLAEASEAVGLDDFWHSEPTGNVDARDGFEQFAVWFDYPRWAEAIAATEPGASLLADAAETERLRQMLIGRDALIAEMQPDAMTGRAMARLVREGWPRPVYVWPDGPGWRVTLAGHPTDIFDTIIEAIAAALRNVRHEDDRENAPEGLDFYRGIPFCEYEALDDDR